MHESPTKSEIMSSWSLFEHCSWITRLAHRKSYQIIICPMWHMKSWPTVTIRYKLKSVRTFAKNYSSSPYEVLSGHYLPQFIWKVWPKENPRSSWSRYRTLLRITHLEPIWIVYMVTYLNPIHMYKVWPNMKLGHVIICSRFDFICPCLTPRIQFVSIFSLNYLHLPLFTYMRQEGIERLT